MLTMMGLAFAALFPVGFLVIVAARIIPRLRPIAWTGFLLMGSGFLGFSVTSAWDIHAAQRVTMVGTVGYVAKSTGKGGTYWFNLKTSNGWTQRLDLGDANGVRLENGQLVRATFLDRGVGTVTHIEWLVDDRVVSPIDRGTGMTSSLLMAMISLLFLGAGGTAFQSWRKARSQSLGSNPSKS
ncbi:hypothetical protein SAMN05421819_4363 [Bryocella elongata]|uniref:Uncharacterized protein n=1 Tax=Bryocella elongata TaxID=863522 RepID=A0A1H6CB05_9BACT|nr:hypothetical protein [Bryocella elongata]SEG69586.1 hypothetical protein SAMN05421819_4363 [Bryocella elongata]